MSDSRLETQTLEPQVIVALYVDPKNPNHHLWNNHGTWFLHYTTYPTPFTAERVRRSLKTKDVFVARHRRDKLLGLEQD